MFSQKLWISKFFPSFGAQPKHYPLCEIVSDFLWWMSLLWIPKALDLQLYLHLLFNFDHSYSKCICIYPMSPYGCKDKYHTAGSLSLCSIYHLLSTDAQKLRIHLGIFPIIFFKKILPNAFDPSSHETASRAFPPSCLSYSGCIPQQQCCC